MYSAQQRLLRSFLVVLVLAATQYLFAAQANAGWLASGSSAAGEPRDVIFVGNNWEGAIDVIDADTYEPVGRINGIPDKRERMREIFFNPVKLLYFQAIRHLIGEGHDQYVDDMYSSQDGRLLIVSRPSFADVVAIDIASGKIEWRFPVKGFRSDHMALSPDGTEVAVSAFHRQGGSFSRRADR